MKWKSVPSPFLRRIDDDQIVYLFERKRPFDRQFVVMAENNVAKGAQFHVIAVQFQGKRAISCLLGLFQH
jgi:hypothetical protein